MPNHNRNKLIIIAPQSEHASILERFCKDNAPDFERLVPIPGVYWGMESKIHHDIFGARHCWYEACCDAWGTKWGPYSIKPPISEAEALTLQFETANNAPHPVILEMAHQLHRPMKHGWCDEGGWGGGWIEYDADGFTATIRHTKHGNYQNAVKAHAELPVLTEPELYAEFFPERVKDREEDECPDA